MCKHCAVSYLLVLLHQSHRLHHVKTYDFAELIPLRYWHSVDLSLSGFLCFMLKMDAEVKRQMGRASCNQNNLSLATTICGGAISGHL